MKLGADCSCTRARYSYSHVGRYDGSAQLLERLIRQEIIELPISAVQDNSNVITNGDSKGLSRVAVGDFDGARWRA